MNGNGHSANCTCIECDVLQLARNHYFTGKLLVERDFTDEQRYYLGKLRRHNRDLHGWGTVCGLKVVEHQNPACRDQYVLIEPGLAIDCCGREILVTREEYFDFRARFLANWQQQNGPKSAPDANPHLIQICARYRECPTENVPALFDDCQCDDAACQPNRILETYDFDVKIDPKQQTPDPIGVVLNWRFTLDFAHESLVAVDEANNRLYIVTADNPAKMDVFSTDTYVRVASHTLPAGALDIALSPQGDRVYVAVNQPDPVVVLNTDIALLGTPGALVNTLPLAGSVGGNVRLAVSPSDGRLYTLNIAAATLVAWNNTVNTAGADLNAAKLKEIPVGAAPADLVLAPDGSYALVANSGDATISLIDGGDLNAAPVLIQVAGAAPSDLAISGTSAGLRLFVADAVNQTVRILSLKPGAAQVSEPLGDPLPLAPMTPVDLAVSPGGRWIYAVVTDAAGKSSVQAIDGHRVELKEAGALGTLLPIGEGGSRLTIAAAGRRLYAAFQGKAGDPAAGGVAIIDIAEEPCRDLFLRALDPCPACDEGDCIVLATIKDYKYGDAVDQSRIDNLVDRHLLPSTDLITDVVKCLLDQGTGTGQRGEQGPPGQKGDPGVGVKSASAVTVNPGDPATAAFDPNTGNIAFQIPKGDKGDPGQSVKGDAGIGLNFTLPRILAINWPHGGDINISTAAGRRVLQDLNRNGLLVAFTKTVEAATLTPQSFEVLVRHEDTNDNQPYQVYCFCNITGLVAGAKVDADCDNGISGASAEDIPKGAVPGARFRPVRGTPPNTEPVEWQPGEYRVRIYGDYILGTETIKILKWPDLVEEIDVQPALDAKHLGPGLIWPKPIRPANQPHRCPTGNGTEGGVFESWFRIVRAGQG